MSRPHLPAIAALAVALLLPGRAAAEPAVIAVFEAVARAEPSPTAAPLQTLAEGTGVTVSEEGRDGWRRIRLTGGGIGWIEERALAFPTAGGAAGPVPSAPAAPISPVLPAPAAAAPTPDLRARIYVKDLDHLAELVRNDPAAGPKARRLTQRRTTAYTILGVGGAAAAALLVYGSSQLHRHTDLNDPNFGKTGDGPAAITGGAITAMATMIVSLAVAPGRSDLLDVINTWNTGHPDQPFVIGEHSVGR